MKPLRCAVSPHGMVATAHYLATEAAVEVLEDGGNAMDAGIAAAFALAVCEPYASGLGGQSMLLFHDAASQRTLALDGSSHAPRRLPPDALRTEHYFTAHRAITVPSTPAVLSCALQRYGRLPLARVLEPAIRLAAEGYHITPLQHDLAQRTLEPLRAGSAARLFLQDGQQPYPVGSRLRQPELAETLKQLGEAGIEDFYQGDIAQIIAGDIQTNDGLIDGADLALIPWPVEREPLLTTYQRRRVLTLDLPGAGQVLIGLLNALEALPSAERDPDTPQGALQLVCAIRHAQRLRHDLPSRLSGQVETTHLSVMDRQGNTVSLTQSIYDVFGAREASPELGFLYNSYMHNFDYHDRTHPNYLRPGARPWSSVAPTIVFRGQEPWAVLGSTGVERIAPVIAQVLLRLEQQEPFEAVAAPRLYCSPEGEVSLEAARMDAAILSLLREQGLVLDEREPYSFYLGCVALVLREQGEYIGVADPRRDGAAAGPAQ